MRSVVIWVALVRPLLCVSSVETVVALMTSEFTSCLVDTNLVASGDEMEDEALNLDFRRRGGGDGTLW